MKKIFIIFILLFLFSCSSAEKKEIITPKEKTITEYKQIWKNTFNYYQNNSSSIKKSWIFDFEFTVMIDWDKKDLINKFSNIDLNTEFNSLSFKIDWNYDFIDKKSPKLDWNLKIYLNKRNFWLGDFDVSFSLSENNKLKYSFNNLDKTLLKFFLKDTSQIDSLYLFFQDNKQKDMIYLLPKEITDAIFSDKKTDSLEDTLYKNTKDEEQKIINAFLEKEVIEVFSWSTSGNIDKLNFRFNSDNFISFLNEVAIILWNWNENKNFNEDKELFKNIISEWIFNIQNNEIVDSNINTQIFLTWKDNLNNNKQERLDFVTNLKIIDYKNLNFDFTTLISSLSTPNNKIQIRLKWLIK